MAYYPLTQYCVSFHVRKDKTLYPIHLVANRKNPLTRDFCGDLEGCGWKKDR